MLEKTQKIFFKLLGNFICQYMGKFGLFHEKKQELRAHMALVTRSEEPTAHMA